MALDYLSTSLLRRGWTVRVLDLDVSGMDAYWDELTRERFDLIGITAMSLQVDVATLMAHGARRRAPQAALIRGGAHDTHGFAETCRVHRSLYDAVVVGEAEGTVGQIADAIECGRFVEQRARIPGLAFWDGNVVFTGVATRPDIETSLPTRLVHNTSYDFDVFDYKRTAQVMSARGCANACFYCSESVAPYGRREVRRSLDSLRREFAALKTDGYEAIYFDDPTFTRDMQHTERLCEELRTWGFAWGCNTRVDLLDETIIRRMRESGCSYLFCGLETAVPEILKALNKTPDPSKYIDDASRTYFALRKNRIPCSAFLIFGCPRKEIRDGRAVYSAETLADAIFSLDFAVNELDPDFLSMNVLRLLPGVPFSESPHFSCIRPNGGHAVHAGHYDTAWYTATGDTDLRSHHPIFRAFEGCGSVNPPQMTPTRCYEILALAVDRVNKKNSSPGRHQTRIVVDRRFSPHLVERISAGSVWYDLANFEDISAGGDVPGSQQEPALVATSEPFYTISI